jgi:hypothetical protein
MDHAGAAGNAPSLILSVHLGNRIPARFRAPHASFRADPAVLVLLRMHLAFFPAGSAGLLARLDDGPQDRHVRTRAAGRHGTRGRAYVGAVEVEADALFQHVNGLLGQAGIRAGRAGLCAGIAFLDAADQSLGNVPLNVGV